MIATLSNIADGLLGLIYPPKCLTCGTLNRSPICQDCISRIEPVPPPFCRRCGHTQRGDNCRICDGRRKSFTAARAAGDYSGVLQEAIRHFKYAGYRMLAKPLAEVLYSYLINDSDFPWDSADIIIPIPIHPARKRIRGFNQSQLLAMELSHLTGIAVVSDAVMRSRATRPQVDLSGDERRTNLHNAFTVVKAEKIKGKTVLLVDDVATTCSTIHECSFTLRQGGASKVYAACIAFDA